MPRPRRVPLHRWLATIPGLLILLGVPFANHVQTRVLGMPFLLAWIVGCVLLTALVMAIVGKLDDRASAGQRPPGRGLE
jgi:UDP-N-acetylmuramyl pentapeptide phosphotransferase/UDP-N-acetylglucosamine-1-phosphate transferase